MAHPFASESARSSARRLSKLGGHAGKSWGSASVAIAGRKSYPSKNAGSQVPYFAEGGSVPARPDRLARGGGRKKKGHTTNVIVSVPPQDRAAAPMPVPVPRPVPVPVGAAGAPPPVPAGPPLVPPGGAPVPPGVPLRRPGMKSGGAVRLQRGGSARKAKGGKVHDDEAQDKKLMLKMMKQHEKTEGEKMADGGPVGGGPIKQGGDGTKQYGEGPKYPVMKNAAGGGLGRLEKRSKGEV